MHKKKNYYEPPYSRPMYQAAHIRPRIPCPSLPYQDQINRNHARFYRTNNSIRTQCYDEHTQQDYRGKKMAKLVSLCNKRDRQFLSRLAATPCLKKDPVYKRDSSLPPSLSRNPCLNVFNKEDGGQCEDAGKKPSGKNEDECCLHHFNLTSILENPLGGNKTKTHHLRLFHGTSQDLHQSNIFAFKF